MSIIDGLEMEAWHRFLRAHQVVMAKLDSEMQDQHDLPLLRYDALVQLHLADGPLRMHEFADRLLLSRSATSRFVDRLERDGLVARRLCADDRRGMEVELTPKGQDRLREASLTHLDGVRRYFVGYLDDDQIEALGSAFGDVLRAEDA